MFESYPHYEYLLASLQLGFAMLGMGALLGPRDFLRVLSSPRALLLGLAAQLLLVPLIAASLGWTLAVPAGIAAGLVLVAAVPGGTFSNIATYFGRGNIALSIALTAITTAGALVTTPLLLHLLAGAHLPPDFELPIGRMAYEIGVALPIPLGAGMLLGPRLGQGRERFAHWCIRISLGLICVMALGAGGSGRLDPRDYGVLAPLAMFLLALCSQQAALLASRVARLAAPDRLAIGIEVTIRNTNLAILIKASLFPAVVGVVDPIGDGMFFVALLYGGFALLLAVPHILLHRRRQALRLTPR